MTFTPEQAKALQAPLDPANIKPPPRGKFGSYVDGFHIVTEANRIFGHDGWSYSITALDLCSRIETTDSGNKPQVRVGYRCTVRVEAGGAFREGAAVGTGMAKPENEADAHESAVKEAETDALKRALRSFGYTFGLALYDKSDNNANIAAPEPEVPASVEAFLNGLAAAYPKGEAESYWTQHWPSVPKEWRAYALEQKEDIKTAQGKVALLRAG